MAILIKKHPTYDLVNNLLYNSFPPHKKLTIIDYGCGNGLLLDFLNHSQINRYIGYDVNQDSIKLARQRYSKIKNTSFELITTGSVPSLGKSSSVDAVILIGVLQYMSEKEIDYFLQEAAKVLKNNGALIFSCTTDHKIYKIINIYRFFIPSRFINRKKMINQLNKTGFKVFFQKEKGLIIAPIFSNIMVFFFDTLDKIIYRTKGELGPIGARSRQIVGFVIRWEYKLPIDYGNTLFIMTRKE